MSDTHDNKKLIEHLRDLRKRLIRCLLSFLIGFALCSFYAREIYSILSWPLKKTLPPNTYFISTHPVEAWLTYFKAALIAGLFLSSPIIFYQIWQFVSPGLYRKEKKTSLLLASSSSFLFIGGIIFGYFVVLPMGSNYFVQILEGTDIHFTPKMDDYLSFSLQTLLAFGIIFETPLIVFFLFFSGIISYQQFSSFRKYVIVACLIIAAILTPPDAIMQIFLAIPMLLLYEVGLLGIWTYQKTIASRQQGSKYK